MNVEEFRNFCLNKKAVTEDFPFDENVLVFKVFGKIFASTNLKNSDFSVNLKCDPVKAEELRAKYSSVIPGYHMNKKHWNTVYFNHGELNNETLQDLINHSYDLVVSKLTKKQKEELNTL